MTRRRPSSPRSSKPSSRNRQGKLRIIGGDHRRRILPVLDKPGLRPTPDRVRETLFNWLTGELHGAHVLDLFAGTGALGLEALSRGARKATFVERDPDVAHAIEANLTTLDIQDSRVINTDASSLLQGPAPAASFSIVFLDPPFRMDLAAPCCTALENAGWLAEEAWIYIEVEANLIPDVPANWSLHREVRAGDSHGRLYYRKMVPSA